MKRRADERLWRTRDGKRLVEDGDPDAATLAYAPGDEIAEADEDLLQAKAKGTPANKARRRAEDK